MAKVVDGPGEAAFEATATFDRVVIDGAVNGTGAVVKDAGSRLRVAADRLRPQLRPRHRPGHGRSADLRRRPGSACEQRLRVPGPERARAAARGRCAVRRLPAPRPRGAGQGHGRPQLGRRRRRRGLDAGRVPAGRRRLPVRRQQGVGRRPRDLVAPGRRRHLAVPRRHDPGAVPDRHAGDRPGPRRQAVLRLAAAARGGVPRHVPRPRPLPLLRDVRDRAGPDVLPHRGLGPRPEGVRRPQVLHLHDARLGPDAGRHPEPGHPDRPRDRQRRHLRPGRRWPRASRWP